MARAVIAFVLSCVVLASAASAQGTREVSYSARAIVPVHAKLRFTTLIVLPEGEEILDFVCGDKDVWVVSGAQNLAYVKPAKAGTATNLNLVTTSGRIYSFLLTEGPADPDLKIYVTPEEGFAPSGAVAKLFSAGQVEALRRDAEDARTEAKAARQEAARSAESVASATAAAVDAASDTVKAFRSTYPLRLQFPYRFKGYTHPFFVSAIFHDGQFTYIRSDARELPALYELIDNPTTRLRAPNLINFQVEDGVYIVPKVLEHGYLVIGTKKFLFDLAR